MDSLPFRQQSIAVFCNLVDQTSKLSLVDPGARDQFGLTASSDKVDLCPTRSGNMDMGRLVVGRIDDEPKAVSPVEDDHHGYKPMRWVFKQPLRRRWVLE